MSHLDMTPVYFSRLFPFEDFYRWLSYGEEKTFTLRELAFNFDGERFLRNQAFKDANHLKSFVKRHKPAKIDIGAIFNSSPLNFDKHQLWDDTEDFKVYPVQKELVFDIDLTDYDEVRDCCSDASICSKCWKYMTVAVKIIDAALKEDFAFKHILWTFSGRRGIHCWVCDEKARFLKKSARLAVAGYLQMINGGMYMKKKVDIGHKLHRSVKRALAFIEPMFIDVCVKEQNILGTDENVTKFLGIICEDMRDELKVLLNQHLSSFDRWKFFVEFFKKQIQSEAEIWCRTPYLIEEIMIQYMYPRLDINVSLSLNHLLKSPFCIHPKTGKVGVPLDPKTVDQFDPDKVPTIETLLDEIDKFDAKTKKEKLLINEVNKIHDIQKTSLSKYHEIFIDFLNSLENLTQEESSLCETSNNYVSDNNNNDDSYNSDVSMDFD